MGQCAAKGEQGFEDLEAVSQSRGQAHQRALRPERRPTERRGTERRPTERRATAKKKGYGRAVVEPPAYLRSEHGENASAAHLKHSKMSDHSHDQSGMHPLTYFNKSESYDALSQAGRGYPGDSRLPSLVSNATISTNTPEK